MTRSPPVTVIEMRLVPSFVVVRERGGAAESGCARTAKFQAPSKRKAPSTKLQAPEKHQAPKRDESFRLILVLVAVRFNAQVRAGARRKAAEDLPVGHRRTPRRFAHFVCRA